MLITCFVSFFSKITFVLLNEQEIEKIFIFLSKSCH